MNISGARLRELYPEYFDVFGCWKPGLREKFEDGILGRDLVVSTERDFFTHQKRTTWSRSKR